MFAGPRVAANASNTTPPDNFLEAKWCMTHGHGDYLIEKRKDTKDKKVPTFEVIEGDKTEKAPKKDVDDPSFDWI